MKYKLKKESTMKKMLIHVLHKFSVPKFLEGPT